MKADFFGLLAAGLFFFLLLSSLSVVGASPSGWESVDSPAPGATFNCVDIVSENEGWAAGVDGVILHWSDGSWEEVKSPTSEEVVDISMLSSDRGWAVGYGGTILKYDGSSWSEAVSPTSHTLSGVYMVSSDRGWAVGRGERFSGGMGSRGRVLIPQLQTIWMM